MQSFTLLGTPAVLPSSAFTLATQVRQSSFVSVVWVCMCVRVCLRGERERDDTLECR